MELVFNTYEPFHVSAWTIHTPDPVQAGETIEVTCQVTLAAPKTGRRAVTITLSEQGGHSVNGPITLPQSADLYLYAI